MTTDIRPERLTLALSSALGVGTAESAILRCQVVQLAPVAEAVARVERERIAAFLRTGASRAHTVKSRAACATLAAAVGRGDHWNEDAVAEGDAGDAGGRVSDLIEAVAADIQEAEYAERSDDLGPLTEPLMAWHLEAAEAAVLRTLAAMARRWPALKRSLAGFARDHGLEPTGTGEIDPLADGRAP